MSELSYKELQEQGVFDVPYRAFEYIQSQQAEIDELQGRIDGAIQALEQSKPNMMCQYDAMQALDILKGNKDETGLN